MLSAFSAAEFISAGAASVPSFSIKKVTSLSYNNAQINAAVSVPSNMKIKEAGFYFGTSANKLKKNAKCDKNSKGWSASQIKNLYYNLKSKGCSLSDNTTYYYKFYLINTSNKTYYSSVEKFKTPSLVSFSIQRVSGLTYNNATISANVNIASNTKIKEAGFYIGTATDNLTKNAKCDKNNSDWSASQIKNISYELKAKGCSLSANKTYYYKFYCISTGNKTYYSSVNSFKTSAATITLSNKTTTSIAKTSAVINASISNPAKSKITKVGYQLGTVKNEWTVKKTSAFSSNSLSFIVSDLKKAKTYYYRTFAVSGSKTYYSSVSSFETLSDATEIYFPLSKNQVWSASTYSGHGSAFGAAYSSVDIVLKNGKSAEGQPVYAAEAGNVKAYDAKNGQIVIEHTVKLVTTNNKTYKKWYTIYAHMKNIKVKVGNKVKRGQQIGQVSKVGNATGPHLHFNIISGNGNTAWSSNNKKKAISPYYVFGFVKANGKDTSYCKCDRQGPAVTSTLINWKPTGE